MALEECAAALLQNSISSMDNLKPGLGAHGAEAVEDPRKISGLAVSKIGAEARSHAENAVGQFQEKS